MLASARLTIPVLLAVVTWAASLSPAAAEPAHRSPETQAEIEFLLSRVTTSGYVFVRNGDEHDGAEAASHMRRKFEHFDDEVRTAEEFIEKSATRSLLTRRIYEVVFPDGTRSETARWLLDELAAFRAAEAATTASAPEQ